MSTSHFSGPVVVGPNETAATVSGTGGLQVVSGDVQLDSGNIVSTAGNLTLTAGNLSVTGKVSHGAVAAPQVDPLSCTITVAAGAANTATVTVTVKDGASTAIPRVVPFEVYKSSAADGLTLGAAASTGFSVASGGLSRANGTAVTTSIRAVTSAAGACVLSLLDTNKATDYLVLVVADGIKISAQMSAGSYG